MDSFLIYVISVTVHYMMIGWLVYSTSLLISHGNLDPASETFPDCVYCFVERFSYSINVMVITYKGHKTTKGHS